MKASVLLLAFFFPIFNLNSMHIIYPSESPIKVVKNKTCMFGIAASVEAAVQVTPWRQVDWNSCRLLLFLDKLKCKISIIISNYLIVASIVSFFIVSFSKGGRDFSTINNCKQPPQNDTLASLDVWDPYLRRK